LIQQSFTSILGKYRPAYLEADILPGRLKLPGLLVLIASLHAGTVHARNLQDEHHCLALALYWEARGETRRGMIAVGWTILNRAHAEPAFSRNAVRRRLSGR
jgi:hypothetical protein